MSGSTETVHLLPHSSGTADDDDDHDSGSHSGRISHSQQVTADAVKLEAGIPQWKRDYLAKKQAFLQYQTERMKVTPIQPVSHISQQNESKSREENTRKEGEVLLISTDSTKMSFQSNADNRIIDADELIPPGDMTSDSDDSSIDSDSDNDSQTEHRRGKSGGYSVLNGERLSPSAVSSDEEEENKDPESTETESETEGFSELKYHPGFVSKLLNKWSSISYQGESVTASTPTSPPANPPTQSRTFLTLQHSTDKFSPSKQNVAEPLKSSQEKRIEPHTKHGPTLTTNPNNLKNEDGMNTPTDNGEDSFDGVSRRRCSYRAANEIILIESGSPRLTDVADRKAVYSQSQDRTVNESVGLFTNVEVKSTR